MSTLSNHRQATGTLGNTLIPALLEANFRLTVITRSDSSKTTEFPANVTVKSAAYDDVASLSEILQGQHALIEAFNPAAAIDQSAIVRAAIAAGVKHILTPDFSSDTFNPHVDELMIFEGKRKAQQELEGLVAQSNGAIFWTAIIVGAWYDWGIQNALFWVNSSEKTITRFGSGNQKYAISRLSHVSDFVVHVLQNSDNFRNTPAYFASHTITTNQLVDLVSEAAGEGWKVVDVDVTEFVGVGRQLWEKDTEAGITNRVATQAWAMLGTAGLFDERNRYGGDFGEKLEQGWDEGINTLKNNLKTLLV